jgi:nucleoside-diphosphate-sugar epimerase
VGLGGENRRALVVGANGQIGSRISAVLDSSEYSVIRVSGHEFGQRYKSILNQSEGKLSLILNSAGPNSKSTEEASSEALAWSSDHAARLNELASHNPNSTCISLSTYHVYGDSLEGEITETSPLQETSAYSKLHINLENELHLGTSDWSVLRLTNVFGSPGRGGKFNTDTLTHEAVYKFARGIHFKLKSSPFMRRDFIPVSLVTQAVCWLSDNSKSGTFNLSSMRTRLIGEWISLIAKKMRTEKSFSSNFSLARDSDKSPNYLISSAKLRALGFKGDAETDAELSNLIQFCAEPR